METIKSYFFKFLHDQSMNPVDVTAGGVGVAALLKYLPAISTTLTIVWVVLRLIVTIRDDFINRKAKDGDK